MSPSIDEACHILAERREEGLRALLDSCKSGVFRDESPFPTKFYTNLWQALRTTWRHRQRREVQEQADFRKRVLVGDIFKEVLHFPETNIGPEPEPHIFGENFSLDLTDLLESVNHEEDEELVYMLLYSLYRDASGFFRMRMRNTILGKMCREFNGFANKNKAIGPCLRVIEQIFAGEDHGKEFEKKFFRDVLLPLHATNKWEVWNRQTPLIGMYHKQMVRLLNLFCSKYPAEFLEDTYKACLKYWPNVTEPNTPKEVLLLQEMNILLSHADKTIFAEKIYPHLIPKFVVCLKALNAQVVESVLLFWKSDHFNDLCKPVSEKLMKSLLPHLWKNEPSWNPTVNKMTALVFDKLNKLNPDFFDSIIKQIHESRMVMAKAKGGVGSIGMTGGTIGRPITPGDQKTLGIAGGAKAAMFQKPTVGQQMRDWKAAGPSGGKPPPATITGAAPWATGSATTGGAGPLSQMNRVGGNPPASITGVAPWSSSPSGIGGQPPASVTGVAPWVKTTGLKQTPSTSVGGGTGSLQAESIDEIAEGEDMKDLPEHQRALKRHIKVLNPELDQTKSWETTLLSLSPLWLPTLQFHDIVYGNQDLGSGAFSTVKYGRVVQKNKTQSQWPEYAVKVISVDTIKKHNYARQINQEIAVLKHMAHPNICRMVSVFRWRTGIYLVMEFCSQGDLHSVVQKNGALNIEEFLFAVGEIVAGLASIHQQGFVFGDMKPENCVVTSTGHVKITDFGGVRAISIEAREKLKEQHLVHMKDTDIMKHVHAKKKTKTEGDVDMKNADGKSVGSSHDSDDEPLDPDLLVEELPPEEEGGVLKYEGTGVYLAPELVAGQSYVSQASDSWALGCTCYYLLTKRLPIWIEQSKSDEQDIRHLKTELVKFFVDADRTFEDRGVTDPNSKAFVLSLMTEEPSQRANVQHLSLDKKNWLNTTGKHGHCMDLYKVAQGPIRGGNAFQTAAAESGDPWAKRQMSKIWTVMETDVDNYAGAQTVKAKAGGRSFNTPFKKNLDEELQQVF